MPTFSTALAHVLVAYLVLVQPFVGRRLYLGLKRAVSTDPGARSRFYRLILTLEWSLLAVAIATVLPRQDPVAAIGLTRIAMTSVGWGVTIGMLVGLVVSTAVIALHPKAHEKFERAASGVSGLIPATHRERWQFAAVSVSAGICEEIVFRGFLLLYLRALGLSTVPAVVLGAAVFGLAHLYQGWKGVAGTALMGAAFMVMFVSTGSLVPCIVIHALTDLRILVLVRARDTAGASG